jgi:diacylglycerol kinase (ATP)
MTKFLAVVNPAAGGGRCGQRFPAALETLRSQGLEIDVAMTSRAGEGTEIARREWLSGRRHFIAVGGDGTSYEIVNGLFPEALGGAERPTLGFLPLGTGNSFLRDFTDKGAEYSLKTLAEGKIQPCDVVRVECREGTFFYINILSYGFTADVGALTNRRFKRFGEAGYITAVVVRTALLKATPYPMTVDGGARNNNPFMFVSINNSQYTGGKMRMAPHASVNDGKVAVVEVGRMGRIGLLRTFPKIFDGKHVENPKVNTYDASTIDFHLDAPLDLMVDGEVITMTPVRLDVLKHAIEVRV